MRLWIDKCMERELQGAKPFEGLARNVLIRYGQELKRRFEGFLGFGTEVLGSVEGRI